MFVELAVGGKKRKHKHNCKNFITECIVAEIGNYK
jgi:hypothetical protein